MYKNSNYFFGWIDLPNVFHVRYYKMCNQTVDDGNGGNHSAKYKVRNKLQNKHLTSFAYIFRWKNMHSSAFKISTQKLHFLCCLKWYSFSSGLSWRPTLQPTTQQILALSVWIACSISNAWLSNIDRHTQQVRLPINWFRCRLFLYCLPQSRHSRSPSLFTIEALGSARLGGGGGGGRRKALNGSAASSSFGGGWNNGSMTSWASLKTYTV